MKFLVLYIQALIEEYQLRKEYRRKRKGK